MKTTDNNFTQTELECQAAAFRRLVSHLQNRTDVQNIDLMNLAGFCRNCLSGWYQDAAEEKEISLLWQIYVTYIQKLVQLDLSRKLCVK